MLLDVELQYKQRIKELEDDLNTAIRMGRDVAASKDLTIKTTIERYEQRIKEMEDKNAGAEIEIDHLEAEIEAVKASKLVFVPELSDDMKETYLDDNIQLHKRIEELTEALEKIKEWCEVCTCEICGEKEMKDTDCYDIAKAATGGPK
jgi:hypothetical protein